MTTFKELGLNPEIMDSLDELGFVESTPIQAKAIPFILESKDDLVALAQTGTGKTAAFGVPILNQINAKSKDLQAIIICPTRELCLQIADDIKKYSKHSKGVGVTSVYGGEKIEIQIRALKYGPNIVVGTPGRVHDMIRRKILKLQKIKWVVLDEADEMLDMGFKDDLDAILSETPKNRQTLLFSATMSKSVMSIAKNYMKNIHEIRVGAKNVGAEKVTHEYYVVSARDRFDALRRIIDSLPGVYGIIFCRTRRETQEIAEKLKRANYDTEALHGDVSQNLRTKIMDRFKKKHVKLLVATDVAARGIDVNDLTHVINYSLPDKNDIYTHRSGRTGRAQKSGVAISLVGPRDARKIKDLERMVDKTFEQKKIPSGQDVCRKQIDNFIDEIGKTEIKNEIDEKYFEEIVERLKKIKKDDLVKYFITHKFSDLMEDHKDSRDLNADAKSSSGRRGEGGEHVNLRINFGKRDGLDVKALFGLINSDRKLKGIEIGRISLMPEHALFSVEKSCVDDVIKSLNGITVRGKRINITVSSVAAEPSKPSYGGGRRSGPKRGRSPGGDRDRGSYKKRRGGYRRGK